MRVRFLGVLVCVLCCSISNGDEIPLGEIWGNMPGTKKLGELTKEDPRLSKVLQSLWKPVPKGDTAGPAFVVQGVGLEALKNSYKVLVDKKKPKETFDANREISIVFFSHSDNWYIHLNKVERNGTKITINYKIISHESQETTEHLALIPLGKLPSGKYQVEMNYTQQKESGAPLSKPLEDEIVERIVSGSFTFIVGERK